MLRVSPHSPRTVIRVCCHVARRSCSSTTTTTTIPSPPPPLPPSLATHFRPVSAVAVPELSVWANLYAHVRTGATVLSLTADDENKVFGAAFRTPPTDSTGVAHILEHSVLGGSRAYPVKEPFVELLKSSLQSFLNAMTYPDRTVYPVASPNHTDFYNLAEVYMDAVLHPTLSKLTFQQEGWHYSVGDDDLSYTGVVFNEMKGVYSSPDSLNHMAVQSALFPDNTYGLSSGGDPAAIPDLTFEQFRDFHTKHYHPSNAMFFFYGDSDEAERLQFLQDRLASYKESPVDAGVDFQPAFDAPRRVTSTFPVDGADSEAEKHFLTVGWVLHHDPVPLDPTTRMGLSVLDHLLLGTQSSPLRKALTDSELGEAVVGYGFEDDLQQPTFGVGLKGIGSEDKVDAVEALVLDTLRRVAEDGFDDAHVQAALNTYEFRLREYSSGSDFPKGVGLFLSSAPTWMYGRDVLDELQFQGPFNELKERLASNPAFLQDLIKTYLLERNPHRVAVHLRPDPGMGARLEKEELQRLAAAKASPDVNVDKLRAEEKRLLEFQATPDTPEALASVPSLTLDDVDRAIKPIDKRVSGVASAATELLAHPQPTNGIGYVSLAFDLEAVPQRLLPLLAVFSQAVTLVGTESTDELAMSHRMGTHTGGVSASLSTLELPGDRQQAVARLRLSAKAVGDKAPELFDILREVLVEPDLANRTCVTGLVRNAVAAYESQILSSGHSFAINHIASSYTKSSWLSGLFGGINQLFFVRDLLHRVETDWEGVEADLRLLRDALFTVPASVSLTADAPTLATFEGLVPSLLGGLPPRPSGSACDWAVPDLSNPAPSATAFIVPTQVNYVGKGGIVCDGTAPASASVVASHLRTGWLWDQIRVQGGAYGAMCSLNAHAGLLSYVSYRDPNLASSLAAYDGTADHLMTDADLRPEEVQKAVLSTIGSLDAPTSPETKGHVSTTRHELGLTDDYLQERRDQVLATSKADFEAFADMSRRVVDGGRVVVVASSDAVDGAEADTGMTFDRVNVFGGGGQ